MAAQKRIQSDQVLAAWVDNRAAVYSWEVEAVVDRRVDLSLGRVVELKKKSKKSDQTVMIQTAYETVVADRLAVVEVVGVVVEVVVAKQFFFYHFHILRIDVKVMSLLLSQFETTTFCKNKKILVVSRH